MFIEQEHIGKTIKRTGAAGGFLSAGGKVKSLGGMNVLFESGEFASRSDENGVWSIVEPKKKPSEVFDEEFLRHYFYDGSNTTWASTVRDTLDRLLGGK